MAEQQAPRIDHNARVRKSVADRVDAGYDQMAARLRNLADGLERMKGRPMSGSYTQQATFAISDVLNALNNLRLDGLVARAADADAAERGEFDG